MGFSTLQSQPSMALIQEVYWVLLVVDACSANLCCSRAKEQQTEKKTLLHVGVKEELCEEAGLCDEPGLCTEPRSCEEASLCAEPGLCTEPRM